MQLALSKHANNDYKLSNQDYREKLALRVAHGTRSSISPTYQGGGLNNGVPYLQP